jgi:Xaa-Pro aminopeptidase
VFEKSIYAGRRKRLAEKLDAGLILLPGNVESSMNYPANQYPFRQDGAFLYFFGSGGSGLTGLMDLDEGKEFLYGTDLTLEDVVWMGSHPSVAEMAASSGVEATGTPQQLTEKIAAAQSKGRPIHFLPPYRGETILEMQSLLSLPASAIAARASLELIRAVIALRSVKSGEEIAEIENALDTTHAAYSAIVRAARPGVTEGEIVGAIEAVMESHGRRSAYPIILSTHGEILHNTGHGNTLKHGDLLLVDCGAQSPEGYASDITRTYPIGGKFSPRQKDVYQLVFETQSEAIQSIRPGVPYKEIHLRAAATVASGLKDMGLMKGDVEAAVENGAHALFFPHGLGHMLGLDVHDMEGLGEDHVGYDETVSRSGQFGLAYLRLAKKLQAGYVLTVEPGIYFIPALIDRWKSENKLADFIDYGRLEEFRDARGIRIEDDVLVTGTGARVLGKPIPKTSEEVESLM